MVQVCTVYVTKTVSMLNVSMVSPGDNCHIIVECVGANECKSHNYLNS